MSRMNTLLGQIRKFKKGFLYLLLVLFIGLIYPLWPKYGFIISVLFICLISGYAVYRLLFIPFFFKLSLIGKVFLLVISIAIWLFLAGNLVEIIISKRTYNWLMSYGINPYDGLFISVLFICLISGYMVYRLLFIPFFFKLSLIGKVFLLVISIAIWLFLAGNLVEIIISKRTYDWLMS